MQVLEWRHEPASFGVSGNNAPCRIYDKVDGTSRVAVFADAWLEGKLHTAAAVLYPVKLYEVCRSQLKFELAIKSPALLEQFKVNKTDREYQSL